LRSGVTAGRRDRRPRRRVPWVWVITRFRVITQTLADTQADRTTRALLATICQRTRLGAGNLRERAQAARGG